MVKFRCPQCQQKIAVDDEGAGCAISCPTCAESLIVPPETSVEFLPLTQPLQSHSKASVSFELVGPEQQPLAPNHPAGPSPSEREGVAPLLARLMMNRLTQTLLSQRSQLLAAQRESTHLVTEIEKRVGRLQDEFQKRAGAYERRIAALESDLASKDAENAELIREKFLLSKRRLEQQTAKTTARVELRDTGFLVGV